ETDVVSHEQIEVSVSIIVQEGAARVIPHAVLQQVSGSRDIFKALALNITVQDVLPPIGDKQIHETVSVVIAGTDTLPPSCFGNPDALCHVDKTIVASIPIQLVPYRAWRD